MKRYALAAIVLVVAVLGIGLVVVRLLLDPERVRAAVESQASAALGVPVTIGSAELRVWPRAGMTLSDVNVRGASRSDPGGQAGGRIQGITLSRAEISTSLFALVSRRIEDAELRIENSRLDLVTLLGILGGLSVGPPTPRAAAHGEPPPLTIVNVRAISLRNVDLVVGDRQANVTIESALRGDRLEIDRLTAKAAETTLEASGTVISILQRVARLKIEADPLDLDGLMQFAAAFSQLPGAVSASPNGGAKPPPLDLEADVNAARGRFAGLTFANLQAVVAVTPDGVTLRPISLDALDGRFQGTVTVALAGGEAALAISGTASGLNLQKVATFASGEPSAMTGTLGATMSLHGRGMEAGAAMKTATGTADVQLANGRIPGLQLVRPAVLAFGRPQGAPPEGSGEAFERIAATVAVGGGRLQTNNLVFVSRDVDVSGSGTLTLAGAGLDVKADLKLSEELSAQAGRDLVRYAHEGNRVVLPAVVSGTVESPLVFIDTKRAVGRALKNELQNRANEALKRLIPGRTKKPPER